jgi:hypothetical protein
MTGVCRHGISYDEPCVDCDLASRSFGTKRQAEKEVERLGLTATHKPRHRAPGVYQIGRKQRGEMDL